MPDAVTFEITPSLEAAEINATTFGGAFVPDVQLTPVEENHDFHIIHNALDYMKIVILFYRGQLHIRNKCASECGCIYLCCLKTGSYLECDSIWHMVFKSLLKADPAPE